jgi:hypothetical protein
MGWLLIWCFWLWLLLRKHWIPRFIGAAVVAYNVVFALLLTCVAVVRGKFVFQPIDLVVYSVLVASTYLLYLSLRYGGLAGIRQNVFAQSGLANAADAA